MAFLTVGGNVIPIAQAPGAKIDIEETGGRERMFDASLLESIRARKMVVPGLTTPYVARALAETYRGYLVAAPPLVCNGDLFNGAATNCFARYEGMDAIGVPGSQKWRVRFSLFEA
jgi:hypothetical protein